MAWFKDWFNSPYYHILYQNRDDKEAGNFIEHLIQKVPLQTNAAALDLACAHYCTVVRFTSRSTRSTIVSSTAG